MALHKDLGLQYAHVPYFKTYPSSVERLADSSLLAEDEGKLARQLSDNTLWMLVDYSVPTWVAVGSGGGGGGEAFPLGSVFVSTSSDDPNTVLGYGTWELIKTEIEHVTYATGGTITTVGNDVVHTFTASADLIVTRDIPAADFLLVAGGGAGGQVGGGGGGGVIEGSGSFAIGTYPVVIGAGGIGPASAAPAATVRGTNGGNSTFNGLIAVGGGAGGAYSSGNNVGNSGGSGGGGSSSAASTANAGGSAVSGQGYPGGASYPVVNGTGGGGGGAGGPGGNGGASKGGDGGIGILSSISGVATYYGGGGGGGEVTTGTSPGLGGLGGGGNGGLGGAAQDGAANTGGGGGGVGFGTSGNFVAGANGGSGIFIFRYPSSSTTIYYFKRTA